MRAQLIAVMIAVAACGPRQVEVRTAPARSAEVAIHFTNNLTKVVNVYVNSGESDLFVRQVNGNTSEHLPVPGIQSGVRVTLKAKPIDGTTGYERTGVTMTQMVTWTIP